MCGGGKKSTPAPAPAPTYQYFPEASRTPQQQVASSQGPDATSSFGSDLGGGAPAASAVTGVK